jgi:hypothetical protein
MFGFSAKLRHNAARHTTAVIRIDLVFMLSPICEARM